MDTKITKLYLKNEFVRGQARGQEDRKKITKFIRQIYNKVDFAAWIPTIVWLIVTTVLMIPIAAFSLAVKFGVYIPNPDIKTVINISEWHIIDNLMFSIEILTIILVLCIVIATSQEWNRIQIRKSIRENHIDVIK